MEGGKLVVTLHPHPAPCVLWLRSHPVCRLMSAGDCDHQEKLPLPPCSSEIQRFTDGFASRNYPKLGNYREWKFALIVFWCLELTGTLTSGEFPAVLLP